MAADSRARLERAALEAFRLRGYKRASTRDIARAAGMNEASLFRLFGSKANLLYSAVETATISTADLDFDPAAEPADFEVALRRLVAEYLRLYIRQMPIYRLFMIPVLHDQQVNRRIFARVETLIAHFAQFLAQARARDQIAAADYAALAEMLFSDLLFRALALTRDAAIPPAADEVAQAVAQMSAPIAALLCPGARDG